MVWSGLTISPAREEVVDFSYPFWEESLGVLTVTKPEEQFFIFRPLHIYVWISYFGLTVMAAVFVRYMESHYSRSEKISRSDEYHALSFTRSDVCIWYTFGAMWNQGNCTCMAEYSSGRDK